MGMRVLRMFSCSHCKCVVLNQYVCVLLWLLVILYISNQSMTDDDIRDSNQCYSCSVFDYQCQKRE